MTYWYKTKQVKVLYTNTSIIKLDKLCLCSWEEWLWRLNVLSEVHTSNALILIWEKLGVIGY